MSGENFDIEEQLGIVPPIQLGRIDTGDLLVYLATRTPISVEELATHCGRSSASVRRYLTEELSAELDIDSTGFVTLSDGGRKPLLNALKPLLATAKEKRKTAAEHRTAERYDAAADCYRESAAILASVRDCLRAAGYGLDRLADALETVRKNHDMARKEHAKDVINHRLLLVSQRTEEGDDALTADRIDEAEDRFESALAALDEARAAGEEYNDSRLAESSPELGLAPLEERREQLETKRERAAEMACDSEPQESVPSWTSWDGSETEISGASNVKASETPAADSEPSDPDDSTDQDDEFSDEELLDLIRTAHEDLGELPAPYDITAYGAVGPAEYRRRFGSWREARRKAIDVEGFLLDEIHRVAEDVGHRPRTTDMNERGAHTASMYTREFGSWSRALTQAGFDTPDESTRADGTDESDSVAGSTAEDGTASSTPEEGPDLGELSEDQREIVLDLDQVAEQNGWPPSTLELKRDGDHSIFEIRDAFGDFETAVAEAEDFLGYEGEQTAASREPDPLPDRKCGRTGSDTDSDAPSQSSVADSNPDPPGAVADDGSASTPDEFPVTADSVATWEDISRNERLQQPIILRVNGIQFESDGKRLLDVEDLTGREFLFADWNSHELDIDWQFDHWYRIEEARGKVWEKSDGTIARRLSSTQDLRVADLGAVDSPPSAGGDTDLGEASPSAAIDSTSTGSGTDRSSTSTDEEPADDDGEDEEEEQSFIDKLVDDAFSAETEARDAGD